MYNLTAKMNSPERDKVVDVSAQNLPSEGLVRECDTQLSTLLKDLGISLMPDSTVQDEALVYLVNTCPEQPLIRVADAQPEIEEPPAAVAAAPKQSSTKKRRRVVVNKKRHSKKLDMSNSSSSSFSSSSNYSPPSKTMTSVRSDHLYCQPTSSASISEGEGNVCRFHCKKCGQLRFLLVRGCLPERMCECGSTSVSVPTWTKAGHSLTGGGLGRESFACPRCLRIYSSGSQLLKHNCYKKMNASTVENPLQALGVAVTPKCPHCSESFIFDKLLTKHIQKSHKPARK